MTTTKGPAVPIYSPSQINDWLDCPRKWGFGKIDRLPRPQAASAAFGTVVHDLLEGHLKGGTIPFHPGPNPTPVHALISVERFHLAAELAHLATAHLPPPNAPGLVVEGGMDLSPSHGLHRWTGRIDWMWGIHGTVTIGDHKTTSDVKAWGKSAADLRSDVQANVYGKWGLDSAHTFPLDSVHLQWTYIQTTKAKIVEPVRLILERREVDQRFSEIDQIALDITRIRSDVRSAIELPYESASCGKYGGCPFQSKCNLSPLERLKSTMSNGSALFDRLANKPGAAPAANAPHALPMAQPPAPVAPPPPPAAAPSGLSGLAIRDASGRVTHAVYTRRPLDRVTVESQHVMINGAWVRIDPITPDVVARLEELAELVAKHGPETQAIVAAETPAPVVAPPPAPVQAAPVVPPPPANPGWAPEGQTPPAPVVAPGQINPPEFRPPPLVQAPPPAPAAPVPPEASASGRKCSICGGSSHNAKTCPGRPIEKGGTGTGSAVVQAPPAAPQPPPAYAPPSAPAPVQATPAVAPEGSFALFLGCRPVTGWSDPIVEAESIFAEARRRLVAGGGPADFGLIKYEGAATLAMLTEEIVREIPGAFAIVLDPRLREAEIVTSRLVTLARLVVRGLG